jgi:hypothetical protein
MKNNASISNSLASNLPFHLGTALMGALMAGMGCCAVAFLPDDDSASAFPQLSPPIGGAIETGERAPIPVFAAIE